VSSALVLLVPHQLASWPMSVVSQLRAKADQNLCLVSLSAVTSRITCLLRWEDWVSTEVVFGVQVVVAFLLSGILLEPLVCEDSFLREKRLCSSLLDD
jgi:hypothetical protein